MRFALRVQPRNMLLFACHLTNATAQGVQIVRLVVRTKGIVLLTQQRYKYGHKDTAAVTSSPDVTAAQKEKQQAA